MQPSRLQLLNGVADLLLLGLFALLEELLRNLREGNVAQHVLFAAGSVAELFRSLAGKHSLMVVDHDMGFVETIADHVTVLHQGQVLAEGSLREVQADDRVIDVYLGR